MKVIVLGNGYVGKEFARHGYEVCDREMFEYPGNADFDNLIPYDVIINCIAKSNTRWCEDNLTEAILVNGVLPENLSTWCRENNKKYVHISTGCLYDRTDIINKETEFLVSHCNYTISKWVGENGVDPSRDLILRPRLLFSDIKDRNNLLCKIPKYTAYVDDRQDSFTCTSTIVGATKALLDEDVTGIFNVAQEGSASIKQVAEWCGLKSKPIIPMEELRKQQGLYLVNNVMDISKLKKYYTPSSIETAIKLCYNELK